MPSSCCNIVQLVATSCNTLQRYLRSERGLDDPHAVRVVLECALQLEPLGCIVEGEAAKDLQLARDNVRHATYNSVPLAEWEAARREVLYSPAREAGACARARKYRLWHWNVCASVRACVRAWASV